MQPYPPMIGCCSVNSIASRVESWTSVFSGKEVELRRVLGIPTFCLPPRLLVGDLFFFLSLSLSLSLSFYAAAISLADAEIHMRTTWSIWPNSEPLRSDTTREVTFWELISSKIGLRGPDDGSPISLNITKHRHLRFSFGILESFLTAFTGLSLLLSPFLPPYQHQHHAVP
ncbi:hypothetical protein BDP55DRAFT_19072 [Colletotrichum godetiae]|uniref:Uncharacterized protein n=1 Tax=Colletotrichum godetiae TaxID=1209918 RepID=A0AAJ0F382_9PEZI|nr:uncharacterized protein BDP55DRAFT_19072 [Colletotrichum godetiae]KAK1701386.1 hypothetical protein BDP55DRAFT_19072 [Colletotrichum godetiae]